MKIVVIANEFQVREFSGSEDLRSENLRWISSLGGIDDLGEAEVVIDLLFDESPHDEAILKSISGKLVVINSVVRPLEEISGSFVRINGWNGFLNKKIIEASGNEGLRGKAEKALAELGHTIEWVPDLPGFISPRVISMIINEAFLSLGEGVSSKDQINIAMKLGTNYPLGPFEWAEKIGPAKVKALLDKLAEKEPKYSPAENLI